MSAVRDLDLHPHWGISAEMERRPAGHYDRLGELIALLLEHTRGLGVPDIAQRLGIQRQSVYRLRYRLQEKFGIWLEEHDTHPDLPRGWLRWPKSAAVPLPISLTEKELIALRSAVACSRPLAARAAVALTKLLDGSPLGQALEGPGPIPASVKDDYPPDLYQRLMRAIRLHTTTLVTYRNARGQEKTYAFDPYAILARERHLYVLGASHDRRVAGQESLYELRLDQIQHLVLQTSHFSPPDLDLAAYVNRRWGAFSGEGEPVTVRVRFSTEKAQFIRRTRRHVTQQVEDLEDGAVIWQVRVALSEDLVHWIVSWGPHARVLEPEELRRRVVEWARGAVEGNE